MISQLKNNGYQINDPWDAVTIFENKLADYAGSKYAVCTDSCSNAMFLCMKYLKIENQIIEIPAHTYASTPMQCIHAGNQIRFTDQKWSGEYWLSPTPIIDAATRFRKNMYVQNSYYCVSFHHRKTLKIGRGGVILTDDLNFVKWARPMIYDGRNKDTMYKDDIFAGIGYHMYMTPEEAAIGILLMDQLGEDNPDTGDSSSYTDLRKQKVFKPYYA